MKRSTKVVWMKEISSRCDHYGYIYNAPTPDQVTFLFGSWDECGCYTCTKCGKRFFELDEHYNHIKISHEEWLREFLKND